jgi:HSP20 family protein
MANITVRKNEGEERRELEPARWLRDFLGWDPFREMSPYYGAEARAMRFSPDFEVKETKEGFSFKADMPGIKDSDLEITLVGNRLGITGKRESEREEKGETYYVAERSYGSFSRSFTLPEGVDTAHLRAELKDGVLMIALPKLPEMQPRKIDVKTAEAKKS